MSFKFEDTYVNRELFFSVGKELVSGKPYISIPVSNRLVDYEEYYYLPIDTYAKCPENMEELLQIANLCRQHKNDINLIIQPGKDRGSSQT